MENSTPEASATGWGLTRAILSRTWLEPVVFVALALLYIWVLKATRNDWIRAPVMTIIVLIPLASVYFHRDAVKDLGLRFDNLLASAKEVGPIMLLGAALIAAIGAATGWRPHFDQAVLRSLMLYPFWGLAQQFAMQSFTYRRMREGVSGPLAAAALTATLFALAHLPNWPLTTVTLLGGYVWCRLFERTPNLITLAIAHGWLAVLLKQALPAVWMRGLRIGASYWTWTP